MNLISYIWCLLILHTPVYLQASNQEDMHTLANVRTNIPDDTSKVLISRKSLHGNEMDSVEDDLCSTTTKGKKKRRTTTSRTSSESSNCKTNKSTNNKKQKDKSKKAREVERLVSLFGPILKKMYKHIYTPIYMPEECIWMDKEEIRMKCLDQWLSW